MPSRRSRPNGNGSNNRSASYQDGFHRTQNGWYYSNNWFSGPVDTSNRVRTSDRVHTGNSAKSRGYGLSGSHVYLAAVYGLYEHRDGQHETLAEKANKFCNRIIERSAGEPKTLGPSHLSGHPGRR
jgi:hypothetical protein